MWQLAHREATSQFLINRNDCEGEAGRFGRGAQPTFFELTAMAERRHVVLSSKSEASPQHRVPPGHRDMSVDCSGLGTALKSLLGEKIV